ncbi:MetQ/NlpA family ABC transporter substrate-binding protein [Georgenia sp. SUBG003]|uniref:MetQ/NlpA family ABC transporter substrate-binding protein n=1 Tax=Georgenia sp. SUBG003 TaxID=1497974 RepID=UPI003AB7EE8F
MPPSARQPNRTRRRAGGPTPRDDDGATAPTYGPSSPATSTTPPSSAPNPATLADGTPLAPPAPRPPHLRRRPAPRHLRPPTPQILDTGREERLFTPRPDPRDHRPRPHLPLPPTATPRPARARSTTPSGGTSTTARPPPTAGLITLADDAGVVPDPTDIVEEESKVTVTPVDANQTVVSLDSVDASVVNNDFIDDAGLKPEDALFADSAESEGARPYINVWVAREDAGNETFQQLVEIHKSPEVTEALQESAGGTASMADQSPEELQEILAEVQASLGE